MYEVEDMNISNDKDERYYEDLFFISEAYDAPEDDSVVILYLQENVACLFCFFDNDFTGINTIDEKLTLPKSDGLFITVSYKRGIDILKGMGYLKVNTESASFGVCIDDIHQRTMVNIYREYWKRKQ